MTSKEYIKGVLYNLEEALDNAKENKNKDLEIDCKMQKEAYNQVLKDLEDYEELKKLMGTPIQDIMKKLKVLEILKKCEDEKHSLYCVYVLNALSSGKITQDDVIDVKEYLDGKD